MSFDFKYKSASIFNDYRSVINRETDFIDSYQLIWESDYVSDLRNQSRFEEYPPGHCMTDTQQAQHPEYPATQ